jgi:hypothetical protein
MAIFSHSLATTINTKSEHYPAKPYLDRRQPRR